jgi:hypothetical protein
VPVVIEWIEKGKEGGRQEWGTGESDKGTEIVYGPEESITERKTEEKGQKGDREKREKKGEGRRGKRNRRNGKNDMRKQERDRRKVEKKTIPNVRLSARKQFWESP